MCGVAGVIFRQPGAIGKSLLDMLRGCQHRGPDSTGLALYGPQVSQDLVLRVFLDADRCGDESSWDNRKTQLQEVLKKHDFLVHSLWSEYAQMKIAGVFEGDIQSLSYAVEEIPGVEIFSAGHSLEIVKDEGTADDIEQRFKASEFHGYHGIGHVRLATESDVDPSSAHPFWAYGFKDVAIVHNGQITNYYKTRRRLEQRGYRFRTDNDSEVIAVYLADKMDAGLSMEESLQQSLRELDGTFSFLVSTSEGMGFAKDPIGAKPMVVCETDQMVAVASEEAALQCLFGDQKIDTYEPYPGTSYTWSKSMSTTSAVVN